MHWVIGRSKKVFQAGLIILLVLVGCTNSENTLNAPVETPEGAAYAAFEVHRNSLVITGADFLKHDVYLSGALVTVGLQGRGLLYPNDFFATPLILQSGADFLGLDCVDENKVFACGVREDGSAIFRGYVGDEWNTIAHSATGNFTAIDNYFLCSDEGEILNYTSSEKATKLVYQAPEGVRFNGIKVGGRNDPIKEVVAVGDGGAIFHRPEGGVFIDESIPGGPDFIAVEGHHRGSNILDLFALSQNEIWHFDQGTWNRVYLDPGVVLNNIKYISDDETIAVGDGGLILRWKGVDWTVESLGEDVDITAVALDTEYGGFFLCGSKGEVFRHTGGVSNLDHHASGPWSAFFTTDDGTKYAANANKLMRHESDHWIEEAVWDWGRKIVDFHVVDAANIWVIGEMGDGVDHFILFYNGNDWSISQNSSLESYHAIWCDANGDNVFVAADRGQIWWRHDGVWEPEVDLGTSDAFRALQGAGMEDLLAVGDTGKIMRRGPSGWSIEASGTTENLRSAHGPIVVGDGGTILRQVNGSWKGAGLQFDVRYNAVWYGGDSDIWAVGEDASVMHFDGSEWTRLLTHLPGINFLAATGAGGDRVWIGGSEGYLLRSPQ